MTDTNTAIPESTTAREAIPPDHAMDIKLFGLAHLRLIGARPSDLAAVEAQFGPAHRADGGTPDLTLRYVEHIKLEGTLRYLGPAEAGFADNGFVVLNGRFRKPVKVRLPVGDLGGPCEVICEHGVGRVPHLVALVNLAILANGGLALHASGFEADGAATVVTGWSKGGKTEALLAHCKRGARYVGDEWLHLHPDGRISGIEEPLRVWDWHLDQLPDVRANLPRTDRTRLRALRTADKTLGGRASRRIGTTIARQRFVDLAPSLIAPAGRAVGPLPMGPVFLMTSADQRTTTVRSITGAEIADRMAASLTFERSPLLAAVTAFRYAFPATLTTALDRVPELERERLHSLLDAASTAEVIHPYPVHLDEMADAMAAWPADPT